jgi:hypothetical protein
MRRALCDTKLATALAAFAAVGALIAGAVAMSGCGASATLDPIARAAEVSSQQSGARIAMTMQFSAPALGGGASYTITADGSFDEKARSGEMTMDLSQIPGLSALPGGAGNGQIQMVFLYPVIYMNMPFLAGRLPEGKTWMKLDITKAASAAGIDASSLSSIEQSDPTRFLDYLRSSSGGVISLGGATVDGVATTHYRATLQLSRILASLPGGEQAAAKTALEKLGTAGAIPVEVWIDAQSRVRRMQMAFSGLGASAGAAAGASFSITIDFKSYGPVAPVLAPPASQVFDASSMVASGIQGSGAVTGG